MSFERIVIATNNSDNKFVKNRHNGYLFKNGNYKELVKIIEEILKNKKENTLLIILQEK